MSNYMKNMMNKENAKNVKNKEKKEETKNDNEDSINSKRRNSATDLGLYDSKLYKVNRKQSKKDKYRINRIRYEINSKEIIDKLNKAIEKEREKEKRKESS